MAVKKQTRLKSESALFLVVLAAIVVAANFLGVFLHLRIDTTEKELFSLSKGSKRLASSLEDDMEIRAYFSKDLPPPHNSTERYVRDLLSEYRDASGGKITVRFIAPEKDEDKQAAERDGVRKVQDQKLESDSFSVQEGYRGVSFHYLGDSKALAAISTTAGLEYEITQTIKGLVGEKITIGVVTGYGGPTLAEGLSALKQWLPTYELEEFALGKEVPDRFKALIILHPETPFNEAALQYINKYVMKGGSLAVFGGGIKIDPSGQAPTGTPVDPGLNRILEKWGVKIESNVVADARCGRARLPTRIGIPIPVPYPPVPIIVFDKEQQKHPAMFRLDQIGLPYPNRLALNDNLKGDKEVTRTVLAQSSERSWLMDGESIDLSSRQQWSVPGYAGPYTVGVALKGKLPSAFGDEAESVAPIEGAAEAPKVEAPARAEKNVHVLVFGSGFFLRDEFLPPPQPGGGISSAVAFALNAIDWLAQESDLIEIRAKNVEDPSLDIPSTVEEAEATIRTAIEEQDESKAQDAFEERKEAMRAWDKKKDSYRWGNTLAIPLFFAAFGILRWRVRKARRASLKL